MATEEGIVTRVESETAWVKTTRSSACEHCASRGACSETGRDMTVEALNGAGARVGDRVMLGMDTGALLKATFLLYIVPILCLLAGAFAGQRLSTVMGWGESATAALVGLIGLGLALAFVRVRGRGMGRQDRYRPNVVRVLRSPAGKRTPAT